MHELKERGNTRSTSQDEESNSDGTEGKFLKSIANNDVSTCMMVQIKRLKNQQRKVNFYLVDLDKH